MDMCSAFFMTLQLFVLHCLTFSRHICLRVVEINQTIQLGQFFLFFEKKQ